MNRSTSITCCKFLPAIGGVLFPHGRAERAQIRPVIRPFSGFLDQVLVDIPHEPAFVEIAFVAIKEDAEEFGFECLLEHVKPQLAVIDADRGPGDARGGHARGPEQFARDVLVHAGLILHRVVEVEPPEPEHALVFRPTCRSSTSSPDGRPPNENCRRRLSISRRHRDTPRHSPPPSRGCIPAG